MFWVKVTIKTTSDEVVPVLEALSACKTKGVQIVDNERFHQCLLSN